MKVEKRRVLIREYDFKRMIDPRSQIFRYTKNTSWDDIRFEPITAEYFKKKMNWFLLKGDKNSARIYQHWPYPHEVINRMTKVSFYDRRYKSWLINYNDKGELQIRAGINQPLSRLGWAVYEKAVEETSDELSKQGS
jgi:hypothetical protein